MEDEDNIVEPKRFRILFLLDILRKETDDTHGITMNQILYYLEESGIRSERKVIYKDLDALCNCGYEIKMIRENPARYYLVNKDFSKEDLLLLVDVIQASKFLTKRKSESLVRAIKGLGSKYETQAITKTPRVSGRIRSVNQSAFKNVNVIQEALTYKRKVEFRYFDYTPEKTRKYRRGGKFYKETPVQIFYSGDNYYLTAFNETHEDFMMLRIDRMEDVSVSDEKAVRHQKITDFDAEEYERRLFGMYRGKEKVVRLVADPRAVNSIIDRFGSSVVMKGRPDGKAVATVQIQESNVFFGWVAQFRGLVKIESPESTVEEYRYFIQDLSNSI